MYLNTNRYPVDSNNLFAGYVPNITGNIGLQNDKFTQYGGCFEVYEQSTRYTNGINPGGTGVGRVMFKASNSSSVYGKNNLNYDYVIPAAVGVKYCVKYI